MPPGPFASKSDGITVNQPDTTTVDIAIANAARLLHNAETVTDLALMERLERLADSWVSIAEFLHERDKA